MKKVLLISLVLVLGLAVNGWAVTYTGSITGPSNGLVGTQDWSDATLSWNVSETSSGDWKYIYEFIVDKKDISHVIFELSGDFEAENILEGTTDDWILGDYSDDNGGSNPGMIGEIPGIKWEFDGLTSIIVTIVTDKEPMWGDFYAVDGKTPGAEVYAYNTGAGNNPLATNGDPYPIANGNLMDVFNKGWVLVPDTGNGDDQEVPEPSTLILIGTGLLGLGFYRRGKFRK